MNRASEQAAGMVNDHALDCFRHAQLTRIMGRWRIRCSGIEWYRRYCRVLSIRLARVGKKKMPSYRVVVIDKRRPRNGRFVEIVGTYNPLKNPAEIKLDAERIKYWLGCGAQPSDTVVSFLRNQKIA